MFTVVDAVKCSHLNRFERSFRARCLLTNLHLICAVHTGNSTESTCQRARCHLTTILKFNSLPCECIRLSIRMVNFIIFHTIPDRIAFVRLHCTYRRLHAGSMEGPVAARSFTSFTTVSISRTEIEKVVK